MTQIPVTFVSRFNLQVVKKEEGANDHHHHSSEPLCHHEQHHHDGCCHENQGLKQPSCCSHHHSEEGREHHHHYHISSISVLFMGLKDGSISLYAPGASSLTQFSIPQHTSAISNIIQVSHKIISDVDEEHLSKGATPNHQLNIEKRIKKVACKNYFASFSEKDLCVKFWKIYAKEKQQAHQYVLDDTRIELAPTKYIDFSIEMIESVSPDSTTFDSPIVALGNSHDLIYAISERGEVGVWKFGLMSGKIILLSKFNLGRSHHKVKSVSSSRKDRSNPNRLLAYSFIAIAWDDGIIGILEPNYSLLKKRISSIGLDDASHQDFQFNRLFLLKMVIHAFSASIALAVDSEEEDYDETHEDTSESSSQQQALFSYPFESPLNNITYELHLVSLPENSEHLHVLVKQGGEYLVRVFNTAESVPLTSDHFLVEGALRTMEEEFATEAMREGIHDRIFNLKFVGDLMVVSSQDLIEIYSRHEDSSSFCSLIHDEENEEQQQKNSNLIDDGQDPPASSSSFELSSIEFDGRRALLLGCTDGKIRGILVPPAPVGGVVHSHSASTSGSHDGDLETFEVEMPKHCIRK
nr:unnamed protein product [Naegleria fowleri]